MDNCVDVESMCCDPELRTLFDAPTRVPIGVSRPLFDVVLISEPDTTGVTECPFPDKRVDVTPVMSDGCTTPILDVTAGFGNEVTTLPPVPIVALIPALTPALPLSVPVFDSRGKGTIRVESPECTLLNWALAVCDWLSLNAVDAAVLESTGNRLTGSWVVDPRIFGAILED